MSNSTNSSCQTTNKSDKPIYITTPIYYVNDVAHIGHAYTTIIADTLARYSRLVGYDVFFLTGTDEHGQKIADSAKIRDKSPKEYADEISGKFKGLWDEFGITYNHFIRTTDEAHKKGVQKAFNKMHDRGDIYKGNYEGYYCIGCETFFTQKQLVDEEFCPDCGRATNIVEEESYFFRLSDYQDRLLKWYEDNPECILPKSKRNEIINFVKEGLRDLSISRTSFDWGVKLPENMQDPKHVMYVWLDALLNYITALGYGSEDESNMKYHPAKIHLVGKDILRFHAIYWPAFLMSLDLPLPDHIGAHGWWTRDGQKMSKSKGNVIDPKEVADAYGLDAFRYFMLREVPFGQDGDFSQKALMDRINSDLGNDLGNLLNRIFGMSGKYFDFEVSSKDTEKYYSKELDEVHSILAGLEPLLYEMQINRYLEELWKVLFIANKSIGDYEPWALMKDGSQESIDKAMGLLGLICNILAKVAVMLHSIMPSKTDDIAKALGFAIDTDSYNLLQSDKRLIDKFNITKTDALFPRIEELLMAQSPASNEEKSEEVKQAKKDNKAKQDNNKQEENQDNIITIDKFFETTIKIGLVVEAEELKGSKKLLKLMVDVGEEAPRQIIAGIKEYYSPSDLEGTQVCVVANLKPAKLMGHLSQGMILAVKDEDGLCLIRPEQNKTIGSKVS